MLNSDTTENAQLIASVLEQMERRLDTVEALACTMETVLRAFIKVQPPYNEYLGSETQARLLWEAWEGLRHPNDPNRAFPGDLPPRRARAEEDKRQGIDVTTEDTDALDP